MVGGGERLRGGDGAFGGTSGLAHFGVDRGVRVVSLVCLSREVVKVESGRRGRRGLVLRLGVVVLAGTVSGAAVAGFAHPVRVGLVRARPPLPPPSTSSGLASLRNVRGDSESRGDSEGVQRRERRERETRKSRGARGRGRTRGIDGAPRERRSRRRARGGTEGGFRCFSRTIARVSAGRAACAEGGGRASRAPHGVVVVVTLTPAEANRGVVALLTLITV